VIEHFVRSTSRNCRCENLKSRIIREHYKQSTEFHTAISSLCGFFAPCRWQNVLLIFRWSSLTPSSRSVIRLISIEFLHSSFKVSGARGGAVGLGTTLQARKVAGSIPDGIIGIFHLRNPSGRTMALGLTQPLTEMSTRNISWWVKVIGA
jgi:hypothetical protein